MREALAFPSDYFGQEDVWDAPVILTIKDVRIETVGKGKWSEEKPVMYFAEIKKAWSVNRTCWKVIAEAYGPDSDMWRGKQIELYRDANVMYGDEQKGGVRVRISAAPTSTAVVTPLDHAIAEPYPLEQAVADTVKVGKTREDLVAALKAKGLVGYSPTKDAETAKSIISTWSAEMSNTVPF